MCNLKDDARACISLKYKYPDMMSCVQWQRSSLLNDPVLRMLLDQHARIETLFAARVDELAGDYDA